MGKKIRQTEEEAGRQHQGMDRPGVRQVFVLMFHLHLHLHVLVKRLELFKDRRLKITIIIIIIKSQRAVENREK